MSRFAKALGGIQVTGGSAVDVPFGIGASSVTITRIIVRQIAGDLASFTFSVHETEDAAESESESDASVDTDGAALGHLPAELFQAVPPLESDVPGQLTWYAAQQNGAGWTAVARGRDAATDARKRKLFLRINAGGSGLKTFAVMVAGDRE